MSSSKIKSKTDQLLVTHSLGRSRQDVTYSVPTLLFPEIGTEVTYALHGGLSYRCDENSFFILPAKNVVAKISTSSEFRESALPLSSEVIVGAVTDYSLNNLMLQDALCHAKKLKRTLWISELVHRLRFEHVVCKKTESLASVFLRRELLKEVYYHTVALSERKSESPLYDSNDMAVVEAIRYMEQNFSEAITLRDLSKAAKCSPATLARKFESETNLSPIAFLRARRLEKARELLKTGRYSVSDVSLLVGYEDLSAFSASFKRKFRTLPSRVLNDAFEAEIHSK